MPLALLNATEGATEAAQAATTYLSGVVTSGMVQGVFNEIIALLPILVPCIVTFAGIRKGLSFLRSTIAGA